MPFDAQQPVESPPSLAPRLSTCFLTSDTPGSSSQPLLLELLSAVGSVPQRGHVAPPRHAARQVGHAMAADTGWIAPGGILEGCSLIAARSLTFFDVEQEIGQRRHGGMQRLPLGYFERLFNLF